MSRQNMIKVVSVIVLVILAWLVVSSNQSLKRENAMLNLDLQKEKIKSEKLQELSQIEIDQLDLQKAEYDSIRYAEEEAQYKKLKEESIWKTRCLKKKMIGEEESCEENLERYASYNLVK